MMCLSLCLCCFLSFTAPPHLPFFEGPFRDIQASAEFSHKPFLLYFYQNGCQACLVMEDETFGDPELIAFIQAYFLATKKNLMTYEGTQLSQAYGSPGPGSLLIFDHESQVLEHIQETVSAEELLLRLQFHAGKMAIQPPVVSSSEGFDWFPSEEPTYSTPSPQAQERIVHTTPKYDSDPFSDDQRISSFSSSSYKEKQYDWYESTPAHEESYPTESYSRYIDAPSRSHASSANQMYNSVSTRVHKKCYGRTSLYHTVKRLKEKGIRDIQIFPQGRNLQGKPIFILRYATRPSKRGTPAYVRTYRSSIFK